jgi:cytochrome P450
LRDFGPRLRELGHLRPILREGMLDAYLRWALEAQDDFEVWAGPVRHVVVVRPDSVRRVLGGSPEFEREIVPTKFLFGRGMLRLDGEPWRRRRHLFTPPFRAESMDDVVPIVHDEVDRLIASWRATTGPIKPTRALSFLMLRILGRWLFGFDFDEQRHGGHTLHAALIALSTNSVMRHFLPLPIVRAFNHGTILWARQRLDGLCEEILARGRNTQFMTVLRGALAKGELDHDTVIDELRTFMIAGHETTATALAWTVATVASHPELLRGIRAEARMAVEARTPDDVAALEASLRLVKEVMRLYPPVPISISRAALPTNLGSIRLTPGTLVDISSYVIHRLPWIWPEPDRVEPWRFVANPLPGTWIPFLLGPHTCIGARLALIELPLIAARLVGAFDFELPKGPPRVNLRLSLNPAGLEILAKSRSG